MNYIEHLEKQIKDLEARVSALEQGVKPAKPEPPTTLPTWFLPVKNPYMERLQ